MIQGVLPPLTAMTNLPRRETAVLASSAMSFADSRATDSASGKTSIFTTLPPLPPRTHTFRRDYSSLLGAPGAGGVLINRRIFFEHRFDNPPCLFDIVFTREQSTVPSHCGSEDAFVRIHFVRARRVTGHHFAGLKRESFRCRRERVHSYGDCHFRIQA